MVLKINGRALRVERAETWRALTWGLMFRRRLAPNNGMLLCFRRTANHAIHMWNVRFPLDVLFLEENGTIAHIRKALPGAFPFRSGKRVRYVLEVNAGWCARHGVRPGDRCVWPKRAARPANTGAPSTGRR